MKFFMNEENVNKYIEMTKEYDPSWIVGKVRDYLTEGSTLLELGMGEGKDLDLLSKYYDVIGTDNSEIFIEKYKAKDTGIEVICMDAVEMNIDVKVDCIYSNKVLHHLTKDDFIKSLYNQFKILNDDGIIFMTLWRDEFKEETMHNGEIRFTYYLEDDIREIVKEKYEIVNIQVYTEFEEAEDDSLLIVLKKK